MDAVLKSEKAMDVLATISLAQFMVIVAVFIGIGILAFKFRGVIKDFLEDYRSRENGKEDWKKMVQNHEKMIHNLERHHEEDMKKNYENQSKYRQQSLNKQANIDVKFDDVNNKIDELKELILNHYEETKVLKRNELREKLLTNYRYYTSLEQNPSQSWNEMEADAFWHLFKDYEKLNGNGFMHTTVKPAMEKLDVTTIH